MNDFYDSIDAAIQAALDELDRNDDFLDRELDKVELDDDEIDQLRADVDGELFLE